MNAALPLDVIDSLIIDRLQGGFPLHAAPFASIGAELGLSADSLCQRLQSLLDRKVLTRFGPMYQVERMGGAFVLAAMAVPEPRFDAVAAQVNALPAVAHNYRREHDFNMWFVLATSTPGRIYDAMLEIEEQTGLRVYDFPKLREYYVGMQFAVGGNAPVGRREQLPPEGGSEAGGEGAFDEVVLDENDWRLIRATQGGLPLLAEPWQQLASELALTEGEVCARLAAMVQNGVIRRIGAVPNHYAIGYAANGMAVFDIEDAAVDELGQQVGALSFVSHCYRRLRRQPVWPYNLFAMCHGRSRDEVQHQVADVRQLLGDACRSHQVLFSSRILKKSGLRV